MTSNSSDESPRGFLASHPAASAILASLAVAVCYGLGRLSVDAFYAKLHTSAEAVGLGYTPIVELGTLVALGAIAFVGLAYHLGRAFATLALLTKGLIFVVLVVLTSGTLVAGIILEFLGANGPSPNLLVIAVGILLLGLAVSTLVNLVKNTSGRAWLGSVVSLLALAGLALGAHDIGVSQGGNAADGNAVDLNPFWIHVPAMEAEFVSLVPITSQSEASIVISDDHDLHRATNSHSRDQPSGGTQRSFGNSYHIVIPDQATSGVAIPATSKCLLDIGENSNDISVYDTLKHRIFVVPLSAVVVVRPASPCLSAPTDVRATGRETGTATVTWSSPKSCPVRVTGYRVTAIEGTNAPRVMTEPVGSDSKCVTGDMFSATITSLPPGGATFSVEAENSAVPGPASNSNKVMIGH
jgi:hypothetical protein